MTRREFAAKWQKWVKDGGDGDDTTKVVVAALLVGPNIRRIAQVTGLTYAFVTEKGRRLRENKIWVGDRIVCDDPESGPDGIEIALWSGVAEGWFETVAA